jgi:hypothetical protein
MSVQLPNNLILALATAYGTAHAVSAVTNADPAVATTTTAHGIETGALIEVESGWSKLNNRIVRAAAAASTSLSYEGVDTTLVSKFPAGGGIGSIREITTFTQISEVLSLASSGGDMQFATYSFLEDDSENQLPNQSSAQSLTIEISDDATLPGYIALKNASDSGALTGLKMTTKNGSFLLYNGYVSLNETPTISKGQVMSVKATFSLQGRPVRYPS